MHHRAWSLLDFQSRESHPKTQESIFRITKIIVAVVFFMVILVVKMNPNTYPELARVNEIMTVTAIATSCFEVFFLFNYRMYMKGKLSCYRKRRERFIANIQRDFEYMTVSMAA